MTLLFKDNFTSPNFGWNGQHTVSSDRIIAQSTVTRVSGQDSLKFTLNSGDTPVGSSERSEILWAFRTDNHDECASSEEAYYAWSIYLPADFVAPATFCTVLQLHGRNDLPSNQASPSFYVDLSKISGHMTLVQNGGDTSNVIRLDTDLGVYELGKWVDFLFKIKWGAGSTAQVSIWKRVDKAGDLLSLGTVTTPNMYSINGVAVPHYWKRGIYRNNEIFSNVLYQGHFVKATTFEEAAYQAFWE